MPGVSPWRQESREHQSNLVWLRAKRRSLSYSGYHENLPSNEKCWDSISGDANRKVHVTEVTCSGDYKRSTSVVVNIFEPMSALKTD